MKLIETGFSDLYVIEPKIWQDNRGYFFESYNKNTFADLKLDYDFVQDNQSYSEYGTLRGLHFQKDESAQAKFVRVILGKVLDVVVDLRPASKTFKQTFQIELSDENKKMLIVPRGFAHGFVVLSKEAIFSYKCDNFYDPCAESGIIYNDKDLSIDWIVPSKDLIVNEKDLKNKTLNEVLEEL